MADQTVSVTLRAKIDQYLAAMRQAGTATGKVGDDAEKSLTKLGRQMQSAGRNASQWVTAPLLAAGGASVHMAAQFETSFAQMQGLAGVSASEIDGLKASVLSLAGETANSPQQLAEALYFLRSSGLDSAEAMAALELSAQASAAGMGDTAVIADAVSSAMNAYAASGLDAAKATDILVATARAGKAEPDQLAGALGRVLPIASELGITFEDVGGAIAALSLNGNDASTSATLLTNVMSKLLKPSQQGAELLAQVGLSAQGIRQSIADNGLLATLQMLQDKLGDAGFIRFMEDAQAVQGALSLVNDESGNVAEAFGIVADSSGATGEAFSAMADTDAFKMKQALVDVQTAMVQLGSILLPIVADIASGIAGLTGWFSDLPDPVQKVALAMAGVAAAGGPLLVIAGSLVRNFTAVKGAFGGATGAASKMSGALGALGALGLAASVGFMAYEAFTAKQRELEQRTHEVATALGDQTTIVWELADAADAATGGVDGLAVANGALGRALAATGDDGEKIRENFGVLRLSIEDVVFWMDALQGSDAVRGSAFEEMARQAGVAEEHLFILAETIRKTDENGSSLQSELRYAFVDALNMSDEAAWNLAGSLMPVASAMEEVDDQSEKFDGNAITRDFLQMSAGGSELANNLLILAEEHTGLSRNGEHTRSVMAGLLEIIEALPPEAEAAALAEFGLSAATQEAADAAMEQVDATQAAEAAFAEYARTQGKQVDNYRRLITESKAMGDAAIQAKEGVEELEDVTASSIDTMSDAAQAYADTQDAINIYGEAFDRAMGRHGSAMRTIIDVNQGWADFNDNLHNNTDELGTNTDAGRQNQSVVLDAADDIRSLIQARIDEGWTLEQINAEYLDNRENLLAVAEAAGLNEEAVDDLISEYGLVPGLVETMINLAGTALAEWRIQRYIEQLDEITPEQQTLIQALIDDGKLAEAEALLNSLTGTAIIHAEVRPKAWRGTISTNAGTSGYSIGISAMARGGVSDGANVVLWGESGREAMFPLTKPSRIRELWADPRVSGPMLSALTGGSSTSPAPAAAGPSTSLSFGDINVGDRRDAAPFVDAIEEVLFVAKYAS